MTEKRRRILIDKPLQFRYMAYFVVPILLVCSASILALYIGIWGSVLDAFTDEITKVLRSGDKVNITGFGIFKVSDRKAREGRNPKTGEVIQIKASKKPRFTPGKLLKEAIK